MNNFKNIVILFTIAFFASCSNTRFLPDGELLYTGGKVKIEGDSISRNEKKELKNQLEGLLRPKPNSSILGLKPKLYFYNLAGEPKKEKGFRHWLRNTVGEAPVLFSQVDRQYNQDVLQNYVENSGYFNAQTASDSTRRNKKASVVYTVTP